MPQSTWHSVVSSLRTPLLEPDTVLGFRFHACCLPWLNSVTLLQVLADQHLHWWWEGDNHPTGEGGSTPK